MFLVLGDWGIGTEGGGLEMEGVSWLLPCVSDKVRFSLQQERGRPFP